jgi:hypothetical protein
MQWIEAYFVGLRYDTDCPNVVECEYNPTAMKTQLNSNKMFIWIATSIAVAVIGYLLKSFEETSRPGLIIYIIGWISSLIAVGYYISEPSTLSGKIMFGFILIMVTGIAFKILHVQISDQFEGDQLILVGLAGTLITYLFTVLRDRKSPNAKV